MILLALAARSLSHMHRQLCSAKARLQELRAFFPKDSHIIPYHLSLRKALRAPPSRLILALALLRAYAP
jgi:hypothetical protein